jgi:hypothetical protein
MQCSNCGKSIPFNGNVCPYCHADKSNDQSVVVIGMLVAFVCMGIGYVANGACGFLMGALIGGFVGAIVGTIVVHLRR